MSFKNKRYRQVVKQFRGKEFSFYRALEIVLTNGGSPLNFPTSIPRDWKAKIIHHFGIRLTNPEDPHEYVEVFPPNMRAKDPVFHRNHVIYHRPQSSQEDEGTLEWFHRVKHTQLLVDFKCRYPDIQTRIRKAKDELDFFYTREDITYVREQLGFPSLSKQVLDIIDMKVCACHAVTFSRSQGGVIYKHTDGENGPGYSVRAANHPNRPPPFVKTTTERGYHTIDGSTCPQNQTASHIRINDILNYPMSWYLPPCQTVYASDHFNYLAVKPNTYLNRQNKHVLSQYHTSRPHLDDNNVSEHAADLVYGPPKGPNP